MEAVIIYETNNSEKDIDIKTKMLNKGYFQSWKNNDKLYLLPSNCFWKPDYPLSGAKQDIIDVIDEIGDGLKLTRCIVLPATPWEGISAS